MIDAHDCKGVFTLMALVGGCGGEGRPGRLPTTLAEGERGGLGVKAPARRKPRPLAPSISHIRTGLTCK
jgi:hypothetical protein